MSKNNHNNKTVAQLRREGYKVRVKIQRFWAGDVKNVSPKRLQRKWHDYLFPQREIPGPDRAPRGGLHIVEVTTPDGQELRGEAICALSDPFNRRQGLQMALGRALSKEKNAAS